MNRRSILKNMGLGGLTLPFLESIAPKPAWAQNNQIKRVIFVIHRHGTVPIRWAIPESSSFLLSEMMQPLASFRNNIAQILGIDNPIPYFSASPHIHGLAEASLLTAHLPIQQLVYGRFLSQGPSIDQIVANTISTQCPFPALHLSVGSDEGSPFTNTHFLFDETGFPISSIADPSLAYNMLYGSSRFSNPTQQSQLDAIHAHRDILSSLLSNEDKLRLDQFQTRLFEMEQSISNRICSVANPTTTDDFRFNDDEICNQHIDLLAQTFSCDMTRVGTLIFDQLEESPMTWAHSTSDPIYDRSSYRSWEDFIHYGDTDTDPDLFQGFLWYSTKVQRLLSVLQEYTDTDGENLLNSTLVVWLSNFENGAQHSLENLPIVLLGAASSATGRLLDYRSNPYTLCDLWISLLDAIGAPQSTFGLIHPYARMEPIPDLFS